MIRLIKKVLILAMIVMLLIILFGFLTHEDAESSWGKGANYKARAEEIASTMSLEEKIYQMMIVTPEQITGVETVVAAGDTTRQALQRYPVGGLIYSRKNIIDKNQISKIIRASQSYAKTGMFIVVDEEGTLSDLKPMYTYRSKGRRIAAKNASHIAETVKNMGFNLDLAPVADVWSNTMNTVVSDHAYSDDFRKASDLIAAAVRGFHKKGVLCTLKHFPGAGDLAEDLSTGATYLTKKLEEVESCEMSPFKSGIEAGADIVMTGHMIVEAIDKKLPASLSSKVVKETLREKIGFEGLIMTDSMSENVITDHYYSGQAAVLAVKAGNDLILKPYSVEEAVNAVVQEVNTGGITEAQINDSVTRILEAKLRAGIIH